MALNYIWVGFFLIAFLTGILKLLFWGDAQVLPAMVESLFTMAEVGATISLGYIGLMALWLGIMKIGEEGGVVAMMAKLVAPFFTRIFPEVPKEHPAYGSMMMNFAANMLGLDNAATPLGLKAMDHLQDLNPSKETASNAQIMFLVLNTSGLTIIPVSVITLRAVNGAANPTDIFVPILIATFFASFVGLIAVALVQRIKLLDPIIAAYLGGTAVVISSLIYYCRTLDPLALEQQSKLLAAIVILGLITLFITKAVFAGVNVYETFIEGAKDGFGVAIKIIPYLVGMLVAIGMFRASGAMDGVVGAIGWVITLLGIDAVFVEGLPTAIMKPLSGSGARGMAVEAMQSYGVDSFVGRLACVFQGSTETTFYTLAVYFGAVNVRRTRYTISCGLLADIAGIIAAIFVTYLFFG